MMEDQARGVHMEAREVHMEDTEAGVRDRAAAGAQEQGDQEHLQDL